ncbi:MAG: hypothetical protein IJW58_01145, partial [Clostridia bacterium]|nr:hypothetical protein [Clostridia bacterium]
MKRKRVVLLLVCILTVVFMTFCLTSCEYYGFYYVSNAIDKVAYNLGAEIGYNATKALFSFEWGESLIQNLTSGIKNIWLWIF